MIPAAESLNAKIKLFENSVRISQENNEFFSEGSWFSVMQGQGLVAKDYNPIVDILDDADLDHYTDEIKDVIKNSVNVMPAHAEFIEKICSIKNNSYNIKNTKVSLADKNLVRTGADRSCLFHLMRNQKSTSILKSTPKVSE